MVLVGRRGRLVGAGGLDRRARIAIVASAAALAGGCVSVRDELAREQAGLERQWHAQVVQPTPQAAHVLTWEAALAQLRAHNPKMRVTDLEVLRAEEGFDQTKRSLIPMANFQTGYNRALKHGTTDGFDPFYFAATLFFDVPGLINYRIRYEAAVLTLTRAELMRELAWREQVIELYRLARGDAQLAAQAQHHETQRRTAESLVATAPRTAAAERSRLALLEQRLATERADTQARLGDILGLPGEELAVATKGLPALAYDTAAARPAPEQLARLPLRLAAVELVALRARELGVKLRAWPEVNVSVSSPTIYQRTAGQSDYWSSQDVVVGLNGFWALDTQGRNASEARLAAAEREARHEALEQESARIVDKLHGALDGLSRTDMRLAEVRKALSEAPAGVRAPLVTAREALEEERAQWALVLWFFDDARWTAGVPAMAQASHT